MIFARYTRGSDALLAACVSLYLRNRLHCRISELNFSYSYSYGLRFSHLESILHYVIMHKN